jgi:hypothetical protein
MANRIDETPLVGPLVMRLAAGFVGASWQRIRGV